MSSTTCLLHFLLVVVFFLLRVCDVGMISSFASAASDVDPGNIADQRTVEPAVVVENATEQTTQEPTEEQPTVVTATETAEEGPAQARIEASTPTRDDEATRTPPPEQCREGGSQSPDSPTRGRKEGPNSTPGGDFFAKGSPGRGKGPMIPVTMARGSAEGEEAQATSDDVVEEILM